MTVPYSLLVMVRPYGREAVPEAFDGGEALFDAASGDYEKGDYAQAARRFVAAAGALTIDPDNTYAQDFRHNRGLAYRNAAWASLMANQPDLGRTLLRDAAERDTDCAADIEQIIREIIDG
jgi:hypothetical protein